MSPKALAVDDVLTIIKLKFDIPVMGKSCSNNIPIFPLPQIFPHPLSARCCRSSSSAEFEEGQVRTTILTPFICLSVIVERNAGTFREPNTISFCAARRSCKHTGAYVFHQTVNGKRQEHPGCRSGSRTRFSDRRKAACNSFARAPVYGHRCNRKS